jgi:hypothetical protein
MKYLRSRDGFIKPLLSIAILAALVYGGYLFGMPYYRYEAFKSEVKTTMNIEIGDAEKMRTRIYEVAQEFKLPLEEKDIIVTRKERSLRVETSWSVDVDVFGLYHRTLHFDINEEV